MKNIAVLVSGGGSNLQAIIDAIESGNITNANISIIVSSSDKAFALERAKRHNIKRVVLKKSDFIDTEALDKALVEVLNNHNIDLVVLAGYLRILGKEVVSKYSNRIINVHPSLIPAFCGDGYYGLKVHQAALEYGAKVSGATVHFVNEITDGGAIIMQKAVYIEDDDTPETLQKRIMTEAEWKILPKTIDLLCNDKIEINSRKVRIKVD